MLGVRMIRADGDSTIQRVLLVKRRCGLAAAWGTVFACRTICDAPASSTKRRPQWLLHSVACMSVLFLFVLVHAIVCTYATTCDFASMSRGASIADVRRCFRQVAITDSDKLETLRTILFGLSIHPEVDQYYRRRVGGQVRGLTAGDFTSHPVNSSISCINWLGAADHNLFFDSMALLRNLCGLGNSDAVVSTLVDLDFHVGCSLRVT